MAQVEERASHVCAISGMGFSCRVHFARRPSVSISGSWGVLWIVMQEGEWGWSDDSEVGPEEWGGKEDLSPGVRDVGCEDEGVRGG